MTRPLISVVIPVYNAERRAYHTRLNGIAFGLAWHLYDQGEYGPASRLFWLAAWHRPADWQAWVHAAVTSLPLRSLIVPRIRAAVTGAGGNRSQAVGKDEGGG